MPYPVSATDAVCFCSDFFVTFILNFNVLPTGKVIQFDDHAYVLLQISANLALFSRIAH